MKEGYVRCLRDRIRAIYEKTIQCAWTKFRESGRDELSVLGLELRLQLQDLPQLVDCPDRFVSYDALLIVRNCLVKCGTLLAHDHSANIVEIASLISEIRVAEDNWFKAQKEASRKGLFGFDHMVISPRSQSEPTRKVFTRIFNQGQIAPL